MYRVVHAHSECAHYNQRGDREQVLEAGAHEVALIHNWFCHGVKSARGPCATYIHTTEDGSVEDAASAALTEVTPAV